MPLVVYLTLSEFSSEDSQNASTADDTADNTDDTVSLTSRSRNILSILTSKPAVQALVWNQLTDSKKSSRVGAGLFDVNGKAKPILKDLHDLRTNYLA